MSIYGNEKILEYKYGIVNEAYFGKTETLLEIEKQIGIIRSTVKKYTDINRSKEVQALNRLFEKQFGMEVFSLHVEQNSTINAFTIPVALNFDIAFNENLAKKVTADQQNGYRFKEGNKLCIICNIYMGLLCCPDITDAEIVAVILHELGHNFADAIYKDIAVANRSWAKSYLSIIIMNALTIIYLPAAVSAYIKNTNKHKRKVEKRKHKRIIYGLLKGAAASCNDFFDYINEIIWRLTFDKNYVERNKDAASKKGVPEKVKKSTGRANEVIADKFAGIYGYGPEQASALLKMGKQVSRAAQKVEAMKGELGKIINSDIEEAFNDIYKFDCHPHVIQRLNEEIKTLKAELEKSNLDPKLLDALKKQIAELEKLRDEATTIMKNMTDEERRRIEFNKKVNDEDPDAVDEEMEKRIQDAFDDLLEEN